MTFHNEQEKNSLIEKLVSPAVIGKVFGSPSGGGGGSKTAPQAFRAKSGGGGGGGTSSVKLDAAFKTATSGRGFFSAVLQAVGLPKLKQLQANR